MRLQLPLLALALAARQQGPEDTGLPALNAAIERCSHLDPLGCQRELQNVAAGHPNSAAAWFYLGLVAQQGLGDEAAAAINYEKAHALDPNHLDALCNLGKTRLDRGKQTGNPDDKAEALQLWRRTLELDPGHRMARVNLALALHQDGLFDDAMRHWDLLLNADPADVEVLYNAVHKRRGRRRLGARRGRASSFNRRRHDHRP